MGLRERTLTLPVMVAFVASLIWRQIGSVAEAVRVLASEGMLWASPVQASPQAFSLRLRTLPAEIFERIVALRNDVGLLAEMYDPEAKRMLGNFPQAFSHTALVATGIALSRAAKDDPAGGWRRV